MKTYLPSKATWNSWRSMKQRCDDPNSSNYADYGGRGIMYCETWKIFEAFQRDMGNRPEGLTLERVDNSKGYCKSNCIWADKKAQAANRRLPKLRSSESGNLLGRLGVTYELGKDLYVARGHHKGKNLLLYKGKSLQDAIKAREQYEVEKYGVTSYATPAAPQIQGAALTDSQPAKEISNGTVIDSRIYGTDAYLKERFGQSTAICDSDDFPGWYFTYQ